MTKGLFSEWCEAPFRHDFPIPMTSPAPSFWKQGGFSSCHNGKIFIFFVIGNKKVQAKKNNTGFINPPLLPEFFESKLISENVLHLKKTSETLSFRTAGHFLSFGGRKSFTSVNHLKFSIFSRFPSSFSIPLAFWSPLHPSFYKNSPTIYPKGEAILNSYLQHAHHSSKGWNCSFSFC